MWECRHPGCELGRSIAPWCWRWHGAGSVKSSALPLALNPMWFGDHCQHRQRPHRQAGSCRRRSPPRGAKVAKINRGDAARWAGGDPAGGSLLEAGSRPVRGAVLCRRVPFAGDPPAQATAPPALPLPTGQVPSPRQAWSANGETYDLAGWRGRTTPRNLLLAWRWQTTWAFSR